MKIKNKDIILTNKYGEYQRISFKSDTNEAHIWYDDINDEVILNGSIRIDNIISDTPTVTLNHNQLSNINVAPYIHLTQDEYDKFNVLTDGSLVTNLHWHETVNGHKLTVNQGQLPSSNNAFDVHIIID